MGEFGAFATWLGIGAATMTSGYLFARTAWTRPEQASSARGDYAISGTATTRDDTEK